MKNTTKELLKVRNLLSQVSELVNKIEADLKAEEKPKVPKTEKKEKFVNPAVPVEEWQRREIKLKDGTKAAIVVYEDYVLINEHKRKIYDGNKGKYFLFGPNTIYLSVNNLAT